MKECGGIWKQTRYQRSLCEIIQYACHKLIVRGEINRKPETWFEYLRHWNRIHNSRAMADAKSAQNQFWLHKYSFYDLKYTNKKVQ